MSEQKKCRQIARKKHVPRNAREVLKVGACEQHISSNERGEMAVFWMDEKKMVDCVQHYYQSLNVTLRNKYGVACNVYKEVSGDIIRFHDGEWTCELEKWVNEVHLANRFSC